MGLSNSDRRRLRGLTVAALGALALVFGGASEALAQGLAEEQADAEFELPPPPETLPPQLAGEARLDVVFPLAQGRLCPPGELCVFGGGGGVGGLVEWRRASGLALGVGYDVWFLDGNGVHELSTLQAVRFNLRKFFLPHREVHPYVGGAVGALLFGDTFRHNAVGALVDLTFGFEVEISPTLAFTAGIAVRLFYTTEFESRSDGVIRGDNFGVDGAAALQVGLVLLQPVEH